MGSRIGILPAVLALVAGCTGERLEQESTPPAQTSDELKVSGCIQQVFGDGGVDPAAPDALRACIEQASLDLTANLANLFDDGGLPRWPTPVTPTPFPSDGGVSSFPFADAGMLLQPCGASCACPTGYQCLNPLNATCPSASAVCLWFP